MRSQDNFDQRLNRTADGVMAATTATPIATYGEVFADGAIIELISGDHDGNPALMCWDGAKETIGARVEHSGQLYEPATIGASLLQELSLPAGCRPHGSTRRLLAEVCTLIADLAQLNEKFASLTGRFILCSALVEAVSVAPMLTVAGPDAARGNQLVNLLRCLCRHALPLTGVTPAGFCSLASGARFSYLISQASVSDRLRKLLDDASCRDRKIPFRGRLLDLFGVQVIHSNSSVSADFGPLRSILIPMIPNDQQLPAFDLEMQDRITSEFQDKVLSFRRAILGVACRLAFDVSKFTPRLRNLARNVAAATPDDTGLQDEVCNLLRDEDDEIRFDRWVDPGAIAAEAVLVAHYDSPGGITYIADLSRIAQEISRRRGQEAVIDPGEFGKQLKLLGFVTQRDARGKKLHLTEAAHERAQQIVRDFGGPEVGDDQPGTASPSVTGR